MSFMSTQVTLWILSTVLFVCGAFFICVNFAVIYQAHFKGKHSSPAGLIGGGLCSLALWLCPAKAASSWFWLPLVLDPGCLFLICAFIYVILSKGVLR
jgi:hypothetical protein